MENVERIQTIDLRDGDTVFVHVEQILNRMQREQMQKWFSDQFPKNEVVILDGGIKISVARPNSGEMMERIAKATEALADQFNKVSAGGNSLLTEQA